MAVMVVVVSILWTLSLLLLESPRDHGKLISNSLRTGDKDIKCIEIL